MDTADRNVNVPRKMCQFEGASLQYGSLWQLLHTIRYSYVLYRYGIVPADKASNNDVFVCKTYYFECRQKELDLDDSTSKTTYQRTAFSKDEILANHRSVFSSFAIDTVGKYTDLSLLYWIPKLHKDSFKQPFIAGSSSCSTKPLSKLLTSISTTINDDLQKYCHCVFVQWNKSNVDFETTTFR